MLPIAMIVVLLLVAAVSAYAGEVYRRTRNGWLRILMIWQYWSLAFACFFSALWRIFGEFDVDVPFIELLRLMSLIPLCISMLAIGLYLKNHRYEKP